MADRPVAFAPIPSQLRVAASFLAWAACVTPDLPPDPVVIRAPGPVRVHDVANFAPDADTGPDSDALPDDSDVLEPEHPLPGFGLVDITTHAGLDEPQAALSPADAVCFDPVSMTGGVAVEDIDGDGFFDLFLTRHRLPPRLLYNRGDGTFRNAERDDFTAADSTSGAAFGDIDRDGDLDLFVTSAFRDPARLYVQHDGRFIDESATRGIAIAPPQGACNQMFSVVFHDFDHDGDLDLLPTHWSPRGQSRTALLENDGAGHFSDATAALLLDFDAVHAYTPTFADADGDGWEDLWLAADFGTSRLLLNDHGGRFHDVTRERGVGTDENGMGHQVVDLDHDGDLDWIVGSIFEDHATCTGIFGWGCTGNRVFRNDGAAHFTDVTNQWGVRDGAWAWGLVAADLDHDGAVEVALANGWWPRTNPFATHHVPFHRDRGRLWWSAAGPPLRDVAPTVGFDDWRSGRAVVAFDHDGDGDRALLVVNHESPPALWDVAPPSDRHWITVRAPGTTSNLQGIGAVVTVTSGDWTWTHVVGADNGYLAQPPYVAHFGLGADPGPVDVDVSWPATGRSVHRDAVPTDQRIVLVEPPDADPG